MKKPLGGAEVVRTEERVLVLEQWPSVSHIYAPHRVDVGVTHGEGVGIAGAPAIGLGTKENHQPATTQIQNPPPPSQPPLHPSPQKTLPTAPPKPAQTLPKPPTQPNFAALTEREKADPLGVEFLESNDVLDHELNVATEALKVCILKLYMYAYMYTCQEMIRTVLTLTTNTSMVFKKP